MRGTVVLVVVLIVVGTAGTVAMGSSLTQEDHSDDVSPGEEVSGALMVGEAEIEEEVKVRGFGYQIRSAEDAEERADLIAERLEADEQRLQEANERLAELEELRESGEIGLGQYRAEVAVTSVAISAIERNAQQSAGAAPAIADLLEERGVSMDRVQELREAAGNASGEEIRDIARDVRGPREPGELHTPENVSVGPDDDVPGNQSEQDDAIGESDVPGNQSEQDDTIGESDVPGNQSEQDDTIGSVTNLE